MSKELKRNTRNKMIGGVASGLADYFNVDATIIRILFLLALFFQGGGLLIYVILWIAMPARRVEAEPGAAGRPVPMTPGHEKKTQERSAAIVGWILVGLGIWFLMDEFLYPFMRNFFHWFDFGKIWPLVLIIVGVVIVVSSASTRRDKGADQKPGTPPGGADTGEKEGTEK